MTETLTGVSPSNTEELLEQPSLAEAAVAGAAGDEEPGGHGELAEPSEAELAIARELVRSARSRGVAMTGPGGLLKALTKTVIETALDEEMIELWATTSMTLLAGAAATPATAPGPRRC